MNLKIIITALFFAVILPTLYSTIFKLTNSIPLSLLIGVGGITLLFFAFHLTVYEYNSAALRMVIIFGFMNAIATVIFRDNLANTSWHASNNFFVVLLRMMIIGIG